MKICNWRGYLNIVQCISAVVNQWTSGGSLILSNKEERGSGDYFGHCILLISYFANLGPWMNKS
jgi:hypothetical protein